MTYECFKPAGNRHSGAWPLFAVFVENVMVWYRWKWWRLAWNGNSGSRVECSGWVWKRIVWRLMFQCHRTEPRVFRVTDGERCFSCEAYYDHFLLRPEDGSEPWTTVELSIHGLRKC